jgi:hypothetical protein
MAILAGCGGAKNDAPGKSAARAKKPAKAPAAAAAEPSAPAPRKSVFALESSLRDPFFPHSTRDAQAQAQAAPAVPKAAEINGLLQAGFQGVIGGPEEWLAVVNNIILEPGQSADIPVRTGTTVRQVHVRCREISKEAVVLEVQGQPGTVTLTRKPAVHL